MELLLISDGLPPLPATTAPGCFLLGLLFIVAGDETGDDMLLGTSVFSLVGEGADPVLGGKAAMLLKLLTRFEGKEDFNDRLDEELGGIPPVDSTIESVLEFNFMLSG